MALLFIFFSPQRVRSLLLTFFHISLTPEITFASSSLSPKRLLPPLPCLATGLNGCARALCRVGGAGVNFGPIRSVHLCKLQAAIHEILSLTAGCYESYCSLLAASTHGCLSNLLSQLLVVIGLLRIFRRAQWVETVAR